MIESQLKQIFISDSAFKNQLGNFLNLEDFSIVPEVQFINGITADFCVYDTNNQIASIIECKGGDIGVTEYVRGIGQIMQYQYFKEQNIHSNILKNCKIFLSFPDLIMSDNGFDIAKFSYPSEAELLIVNSANYSSSIINPNTAYKELKRELNTIQISPYYFRDTRISELYIVLLETVKYYNTQKTKKLIRSEIGNILSKYNTTNKGNARNVFISLTSLGFIDGNNLPTIKGLEFSKMDFGNFIANIIFDFYKPFINEIYRAFDFIQQKNNSYNISSISNSEISNIVRKFNKDREIYFLTESDNRYISSWLNSLKDDLGCISFSPNKQSKEIIINYNPLYSKEYTANFVKQNVKPDYLIQYLNDY